MTQDTKASTPQAADNAPRGFRNVRFTEMHAGSDMRPPRLKDLLRDLAGEVELASTQGDCAPRAGRLALQRSVVDGQRDEPSRTAGDLDAVSSTNDSRSSNNLSENTARI